jgi:hypothetical protein
MAEPLRGREESFAEWQVLVSLTAVLLLCYVPVLVTPYAFSDDYALLATGLRGELALERATKIAQGRPIHALLLDLFFRKGTVGNLRYVRLLGVLGIAFLAWSLYRALVRVGWSRDLSFVLAVIVCTLPPFQVYASWTVAAFFPFAALASGWALFLAERAFREQRPLRKWSFAAGAILLLLSALTLFQPAAMFFWVFAITVLFKPDASLPCVLRRLLWYNHYCFCRLTFRFWCLQAGLGYVRLHAPASALPSHARYRRKGALVFSPASYECSEPGQTLSPARACCGCCCFSHWRTEPLFARYR